ncbi:uncharacterized protein L203_103614 [Cryptococcus depauperatus CBS 7841]|uniref:Uncharacterized protein n=1 Tax=Cryptococcus depauperatus CBS 7841 TaxID=1295531 RepID=A0A1E3IHW2_9TREE|nr:hypothetical protein L203_02787 [Cryptococcus depauperatus CBS 7841]
MLAMRAQWRRLGGRKGELEQGFAENESGQTVAIAHDGNRLFVGHFMLGNTYSFTTEDWRATFDMADETSLDSLALNIGPEPWQVTQAQMAYTLLSSRSPHPSRRSLRLFLSLDMNVLKESPADIAQKILTIIASNVNANLKWEDKIVLSTFGGHDFGDAWKEVIQQIEDGLKQKVFFWPAFFEPPEEFLNREYVHGSFAWNNAWPMGNHSIDLKNDWPFLKSNKPYMAAVSPLFFTHYGNEGDWAFNKNWIYRSDDLLLPTRFSSILSLPPTESPQMLQMISLNDYGESHNLFPVRGIQPGSEAWTRDMSHEGLRWMSKYYAERWRDGKGEIEGYEDRVRVVLWYRTKPKDMAATDSAQDLINFFILVPPSGSRIDTTLHVTNSLSSHVRSLINGQLNLLTIPFVPGNVSYQVKQAGVNVVQGEGKAITQDGGWNYNFWSGGEF